MKADMADIETVPEFLFLGDPHGKFAPRVDVIVIITPPELQLLRCEMAIRTVYPLDGGLSVPMTISPSLYMNHHPLCSSFSIVPLASTTLPPS